MSIIRALYTGGGDSLEEKGQWGREQGWMGDTSTIKKDAPLPKKTTAFRLLYAFVSVPY